MIGRAWLAQTLAGVEVGSIAWTARLRPRMHIREEAIQERSWFVIPGSGIVRAKVTHSGCYG